MVGVVSVAPLVPVRVLVVGGHLVLLLPVATLEALEIPDLVILGHAFDAGDRGRDQFGMLVRGHS